MSRPLMSTNIYLYVTVILLGLLSSSEVNAQLIPFSNLNKKSGGKITITEATYGASCGQSAGNWTASIAGACNDSYDCRFSPATYGDPAFGCYKDFTAKFKCGSTQQPDFVAAIPYGDGTFFLSCPHSARDPNKIYVTSATYGAGCSGVSAGNWTNYISGLCSGNSTCTFDPSSQGDPASGCAKSLNVKYSCGNTSHADYDVAAPSEGSRNISCP